jgi:Ala-tRNA(Pro) deacylase
MSVLQAIRDFLDHDHVPYSTLAHEPAFTAQEEAAVTHVSGREWAKTVVCLADGEAILVVLPAPLVVNFDKLRTLTLARDIRLASEQEMARLYPDCEVGAIPPLGPLYRQRVFVDQHLARESEIVFSAGTHTDAIRMSYGAFAALVRPQIGDFSEVSKQQPPASADGRRLWGDDE